MSGNNITLAVPSSKKDKKVKAPQFDLALVGTDPHTSAVFGEFADTVGLCLVEAPPSSIAGFLKKEWENWVVLVLDDSVEGWFDVLSLVTDRRPELRVIVVTSRCEFEYVVEIIARRAYTVFGRSFTVQDVDHWCGPLLDSKIENRSPSKIKRPAASELPRYCERCNIELRRINRATGEDENHDGFVTLAEVERRHICETVARLDNDVLETARVLGMGKSTLYRKLKEYGLGPVASSQLAISDSSDQLNQLTILKKQAQSMFEKMKEFERRIVGRS